MGSSLGEGGVGLSELTHAGGVVVRENGGACRYLLVQSSRNPSHWVLPKGHIDPGESAEQAALREVREEAGVVGEIVAPLSVDSYQARGESVRALYFLMRFAGECPADEDRELQWLAFEEACSTVSFAGTRELLEAAQALR
jgi:8-oxo-dGTP pyrophosphatase MutT (NUDIX family)